MPIFASLITFGQFYASVDRNTYIGLTQRGAGGLEAEQDGEEPQRELRQQVQHGQGPGGRISRSGILLNQGCGSGRFRPDPDPNPTQAIKSCIKRTKF